MALSLPGYAHRYNAAPAAQAYAYITTLTASFDVSGGSFRVDVWEDAASCTAGCERCDTIPLMLGATVDPGDGTSPPVALSTLADLMAQPDFAAAFNTIRTYLYREAVKHPRLKGGGQAP
jgi:hypothetical protein